MNKPFVSKIRIYPIKSLDALELNQAEIGIRSLKGDREFAMLAEDGRYVNGKRTGRVNQLHTEFDLENNSITVKERGTDLSETFELNPENEDLKAYLQDFFGLNLYVLQRHKGELMDIPGASSVTLIGEGSLQSLNSDFPRHSLEDIRMRFRSNIEIGGVEPYWEETLVKAPGVGIKFSIGDVEMIGISPRARCNVPPKNPLTGETNKNFVKTMMDSREASLPENSVLPQFGGNYHIAVNTYIPETEAGKMISVGDPIRIIGPVNLS